MTQHQVDAAGARRGPPARHDFFSSAVALLFAVHDEARSNSIALKSKYWREQDRRARVSGRGVDFAGGRRSGVGAPPCAAGGLLGLKRAGMRWPEVVEHARAGQGRVVGRFFEHDGEHQLVVDVHTVE